MKKQLHRQDAKNAKGGPKRAPSRASEGCFICLLGVLCVLAVMFLLFFHRLADRDLWSSHEARAGMDAQTVLDDGAWGLPRLFDGEPELQKPPLYYWLVAVDRAGCAAAPWTPGPCACRRRSRRCCASLAWRRSAGRAAGDVAGLAAAVVLATALHFTWLARIGRIDMPLTLTTAVAVGGDVPGARRGLNASVLRAVESLPTCLSVTSPSPPACCSRGRSAPCCRSPSSAAHLLVEGELPPPWRCRAWLRLLHELGLWWGVPLVLAVTLPWFVWADVVTHGEFFRVFILRHNVERGLGGGDAAGPSRGGSTGRSSPCDFLPWSLLLPVAVFVCWRRGYWRTDPEARLGLAWFLAVTLVLSCAGFKRADYLLPAYPGAALFLGVHFRQRGAAMARAAAAGRAGRPVPAAVSARRRHDGCAGWCAWSAACRRRKRSATTAASPPRSARRAPPPEEVVFFRTEAHALAFHVGRPLAVLVEWKDLEERVAESGARYVVMPAERRGRGAASAARRPLRGSPAKHRPVRRPARTAAAAHAFEDPGRSESPVRRRTFPLIIHPSNMPDLPPLPPIASATAQPWPSWPTTTPPTSRNCVSAWAAHLDGMNRDYQLLLVDDGSTDGTAARAEALREKFPRLEVLRHDAPRGVGAALRTALAAAKAAAVFLHLVRPALSPGRPAAAAAAHRPGPSRQRLPGGAARAAGLAWRVWLMSRVFCRVVFGAAPAPLPGWLGRKGHAARLLARVLFAVRNRDVLCPYRLMRRDIFGRIPLQSDGPFVHVEILAKANFLGCIMAEDVPLGDADRPVKRSPRRAGRHFWKECRRVLDRPDFGPTVLPAAENNRAASICR